MRIRFGPYLIDASLRARRSWNSAVFSRNAAGWHAVWWKATVSFDDTRLLCPEDACESCWENSGVAVEATAMDEPLCEECAFENACGAADALYDSMRDFD